MCPVTVHRLLTERKHIALLGAVAILAAPSVASAAKNESGKVPQRVRLRAEARAGKATAGISAIVETFGARGGPPAVVAVEDAATANGSNG